MKENAELFKDTWMVTEAVVVIRDRKRKVDKTGTK